MKSFSIIYIHDFLFSCEFYTFDYVLFISVAREKSNCVCLEGVVGTRSEDWSWQLPGKNPPPETKTCLFPRSLVQTHPYNHSLDLPVNFLLLLSPLFFSLAHVKGEREAKNGVGGGSSLDHTFHGMGSCYIFFGSCYF